MLLGSTVLIYLLVGLGVSVAVYVWGGERSRSERWFAVATAVPFWPLYVPLLLLRAGPAEQLSMPAAKAPPRDEMATAIGRVDAELEAALRSLDGWAEGVFAREKDRIDELRLAWTALSDRIREMDRLLALPEYADDASLGLDVSCSSPPFSTEAADRLRHSQQVHRQNRDRLRHVRRRAYEDLMGTLAWVRELVSMIHLAKFTGAPASRAEELVAQIAASVEGLSQLSWQEPTNVRAGDST